MRTPLFINLRNIYRRQEMERAGFAYRSVGRPGEDVALKSRSTRTARKSPNTLGSNFAHRRMNVHRPVIGV